ncbi:MAG: acetylornithine deacetylase [Gammaproteobacteria bacterium]|nr:acetylornithine deacetylase [Gammaproteobacteria bacterium]
MIEKLVSFDTVSRNSNMALIDFVRSYLSEHGVESHLVPNEDGSKANLYATIGPMVEGGVVLSGHTDVVPVDGQVWDTDPFTVVEKAGRLYGRGTADMKSFIAIALALVPQMLESELERPIHFALSYDEEVGCIGAPYMIREMAKVLPRPLAVIVGEPTRMRIVNAHKGIGSFTTTVTGYEAHSSQIERGVSAVMTAARLITFLEEMMFENRNGASPDSPFEPPYTTIHVGVINGGTAVNIISRHCDFSWDVRTVPGDTSLEFVERFRDHCEPLIEEMRRVSPDCNITTVIKSDAPALRPEPGGAAEQLCHHLSDDVSAGVVSYATEGGQFQEVEFSTVVCGPGSIDQAHKPNEYIEISQIEAAERFMRKLVDHLAG